jgi:Putative peptidoglycan binding domain
VLRAVQGFAGLATAICEADLKERSEYMKTKGLVFVSCFAAAALIASPVLSKQPQQKSSVRSSTRPTRTVPRTSKMTTPTRMTSRSQVTPMYRYAGTRYYGNTRYYSGGTRYYYGGGFGYPSYGYYSFWPYSGYGYYPYSYSYYGGYGGYYPYSYSYYSGPAYDDNVVMAVQQRLAELGYYHGLIDGIMGPQTRAAISAYEATHNLVVDGTISRPLLDRMGLS